MCFGVIQNKKVKTVSKIHKLQNTKVNTDLLAKLFNTYHKASFEVVI